MEATLLWHGGKLGLPAATCMARVHARYGAGLSATSAVPGRSSSVNPFRWPRGLDAGLQGHCVQVAPFCPLSSSSELLVAPLTKWHRSTNVITDLKPSRPGQVCWGGGNGELQRTLVSPFRSFMMCKDGFKIKFPLHVV